MTRTITAAEFAAKQVPDPTVFQYAIHWVMGVQPDEGAPAEYYTFCTTSVDAVATMEQLSLEGHELIDGVGWSVIGNRFTMFVDFNPAKARPVEEPAAQEAYA